MRLHDSAIHSILAALLVGLSVLGSAAALAQVTDPGVRPGGSNAPAPLAGLTATELAFFQDGLARFSSAKFVRSPTGDNSGLGPRYNSNSCVSCHQQPVVGGSSPAANPLTGPNGIAAANGATNTVPWFIVPTGPVREARFVSDGGVHDLFVVAGRSDVSVNCNITQPIFTPAGNALTGQGGNRNIVFRIPTPTLGAGLIEAIPDSTILANMNANAAAKRQAGISGHPNRSGNDGTITRFGWKAQNKSLLIFSGEAYNVEMGISNLLFPTPTEEDPACQGSDKPAPNDILRTDPSDARNQSFDNPLHIVPDWLQFMMLMRFTDGPAPDPNPSASARHGAAVFTSIGCALCHTPQLQTAPVMNSAVLQDRPVNLFSDLMVHHMGAKLADDISQGQAG